MPTKTSRLCGRCNTIVKGQCPTCSVGWRTRKPKSWDMPYDRERWKRVRAGYLRKHPTCEWPDCHDLATEVDHIDGTDYALQRYDEDMLRALCTEHHRKRTSRQGNDAQRGKGVRITTSVPAPHRAGN